MEKKILCLIIFIFLLYIFVKQTDIKEGFSVICHHTLFGKHHPKCKHIGYYKHKNVKYPIIKSSNKKYLLVRDKFYLFNQKYWNKVFYLKNPFAYNKTVPYSFIYNFTYRGVLYNRYNKEGAQSTFYLFGRRLAYNLYKYVLMEKINDELVYSYSLPIRTRINPGDPVFIKHKSSVYGPYIFYLN